MWVVSIFAHLFSDTGYSTLLRHAAFGKKYDSLFLAAVLATGVALPGIPGIFIAHVDLTRLETRQILLYIAAVAVTMVFHFANANALKNTEASIFAFLYNFRIGFATVLGILFLAEAVHPLRIAGGALVFAAGFLLMGRSGVKRVGVLWSMLVALMFSVMVAIEKVLIAEIGFADYMFSKTLITAGLLWLVVFIGKRPVSMDLFRRREIIGMLIFRCVSAYGLMYAIALGALVSVATYISSLSCITTSIAGIIFLKEKESLSKKVVSGIVAFAGITLIFLAMR